MKKRWPILLIGLVWLALLACGRTPTATPTKPAPSGSESAPAVVSPAELARVRPQVYHRPYNASEQELTGSPTTAGDGDRVRIPGAGKALLRWPDLHVLLYRATEMVTKDVTPTWIRLGILAGTIVAGGNLQPDQRLACDTNGAEVTLPGTTVMVAYHPGTGITLVRVFDGLAQVRNLQGEPRVVPVRGGEWALVGPGEAPQVSGDLTAMRSLARDLDLWDVFSEAEQDVADGFGPAPVPRQDVEIVFVEEPEPETAALPPEISCWPEYTMIESGGCTVLGWEARYTEVVFLDDEQVPPQAEREVCPPESHTFELRAESGAGVAYCRMAVEAPQRPPPVEAPESQPPVEAPEGQPPAEVVEGVVVLVRQEPDLVFRREAEQITSVLSGQVSVVDCNPEEGGQLLGWIDSGDSVRYESAVIDQTPIGKFVTRVASATNGGIINVLGEDPYYNPLVSCEIPGTGGWQNWVTVSCPLTKPWPRVPAPITLEFKGATGEYLFNINWFGFTE